MFGLGKTQVVEGFDIALATSLLPEVANLELDDHALDLRWSGDGALLAAVPSLGRIFLLNRAGDTIATLPGHDGGNGGVAWHPQRRALATFGHDAVVRVYDDSWQAPSLAIPLQKGWAERIAWSPDGQWLAASVDRTVFIADPTSGEVRHRFGDHKSTVCDIAWNPASRKEIATVCDGGARLWRLGESKPFGHFDWGGASLIVTWSPDGRWVVTGDQTPSVHLYDSKRDHPLHIQGYHTKVKALAWEGRGEWLASSGGASITLWPCTGRKGPQGAIPIQLHGHVGDALALDFLPGQPVLASGGRDGLVLLWMPHRSVDPALIAQRSEEISALRWSADGEFLAYGTAAGEVTLCKMITAKPKAP